MAEPMHCQSWILVSSAKSLTLGSPPTTAWRDSRQSSRQNSSKDDTEYSDPVAAILVSSVRAELYS